ncbi:YtzI protein [Cytobacillus sp. IB215665]|nr:YtzI protein [Cytobacillus sp. IB215665]MDX8367435.1 YtzI protein [Cytobacillus sp. IB215665]
MLTVLIISIIIVLGVLFITLMTTSKAYQYEHTVDDLQENHHIETEDKTS